MPAGCLEVTVKVAAGSVWWFAPVFSGGGYSSEAVEFLLGLHLHGGAAFQSLELRAVQHGDLFDEQVLKVPVAAVACAESCELVVPLH